MKSTMLASTSTPMRRPRSLKRWNNILYRQKCFNCSVPGLRISISVLTFFSTTTPSSAMTGTTSTSVSPRTYTWPLALMRRRSVHAGSTYPGKRAKPPDWALEIASQSTGREDVDRKPAIYARIGIAEYWRFDPTGGAYHGEPLWVGLLVQGAYQPVELTTGPDGVLKGYSPVLGLSLCWDNGWPRFYDPSVGAYLENWREVEAARADAEARAETAEAELRRLRAQLENRQPE